MLSRQRDESIVATLPDGSEVVVTVVAIRGDKIRLGVTADKSVRIDRQEVAEDIKRRGYRPAGKVGAA